MHAWRKAPVGRDGEARGVGGNEYPRAGRGLRTRVAFPDAASDILEDEHLQDVTVEQIVERAGVSVGTFYRRIRNKEALLYLLDEQLAAESAALLETTSEVAKRPDGTPPLDMAVRRLVAPWVRSYFVRCGVRRALLLRSRVDPTLRERAARTERAAAERLAVFLESHPETGSASTEEIRRVADRVVLQVVGFLREAVLFREQQVLQTPTSPPEALDAVTSLILGTLRASFFPSPDKPS